MRAAPQVGRWFVILCTCNSVLGAGCSSKTSTRDAGFSDGAGSPGSRGARLAGTDQDVRAGAGGGGGGGAGGSARDGAMGSGGAVGTGGAGTEVPIGSGGGLGGTKRDAATGSGGTPGRGGTGRDAASGSGGMAGSTGTGQDGAAQDLGYDSMKIADGGGASYPTAMVIFQEQAGDAGVGPAIRVSGEGLIEIWYSLGSVSTAPDASLTLQVSRAEADDLFARLEAVDWTDLPHPGTHFGKDECYAMVAYRFCSDCRGYMKDFGMASRLLPEMEPVYAWFDQALGSATSPVNPRNHCEVVPH